MENCKTCKANKICDHNKYGFENCGNYIPADVVPKSEWINVEDSLPGRNMACICRYTFHDSNEPFYQVLDYYVTDIKPHFQHELGGTGMKVTHWMPLPEPPKKKENGTKEHEGRLRA